MIGSHSTPSYPIPDPDAYLTSGDVRGIGAVAFFTATTSRETGELIESLVTALVYYVPMYVPVITDRMMCVRELLYRLIRMTTPSHIAPGCRYPLQRIFRHITAIP